MTPLIPFNRPSVVGRELAHVEEAIRTAHLSGDGEFSRKCSALLEHALGVPKVLLTTSCTHALEMAAILLDIRPGDEVIVPSFTFVSTVNAFVLRGAVPVFIDVHPTTLNLDETRLERLITPRTRAIVPVHYAGVGCAMDRITAIAARHGVAVVEDNAHGLFGKYHGKHLGTFGVLATQSFHETKNFVCGEGGAILINDPGLVERGEIIREKGTNRSRFFRGQVDKYTWVDVGSSYLPPDLMPALLMSQLSQRETVQARRRAIYQRYMEAFAPLAEQGRLQLPVIPHGVDSNHHIYHVLLQNEQTRNKALAFFRDRGIGTTFHYLPLHLSPVGQSLGFRPGECPVTEDVSDRLLRLPIYPALTPDEQEYVIRSMMEFLHQ